MNLEQAVVAEVMGKATQTELEALLANTKVWRSVLLDVLRKNADALTKLKTQNLAPKLLETRKAVLVNFRTKLLARNDDLKLRFREENKEDTKNFVSKEVEMLSQIYGALLELTEGMKIICQQMTGRDL